MKEYVNFENMAADEHSKHEEINRREKDCETSHYESAWTEQDIETLIGLLDGRTEAGDSRIKVDVVEGEGEVIARQYHHGRCDVGSPWACGTAFDVLE